jgi:glycosyltransferase involved in cell wall biosynthesis
MIRGHRLSLVIPTRDEAEGIVAVLRGLPPVVEVVVVVDTASTDGTPELARREGARVIDEPRRGYGRAYLTGVPQASGELVATLDADGTYPAQAIPALAEALLDGPLDFVSAARFPLRDPRAMRRRNQLGNRALTRAANLLFGLELRDLLSGMWVFRRAAWLSLAPTSEDWNLSQEIKLRAALDPATRFAERAIDYAPRHGESKLDPLSVGAQNLRHLLRLRRELTPRARPVR